MAVKTLLEHAELQAAAHAYGLGNLHTFEGVAAGSINTSYRIETDAGPFFLRLNEGKSAADVDFELELLRHLQARGVPVPEVLPTTDGRLWIPMRQRQLCLFELLEGDEVRSATALSTAQARTLGQALAQIHLASRDFARSRANAFSLAQMRRRLPTVRAAASTDAAVAGALAILEPEAEALEQELASLGTRLPTGLIHGDLFPDNVKWEGDRIVGLFDFEMACTGWWVQDLVTVQLSWCFEPDDGFRDATLRALAAGYRGVRELKAPERQAAWTLARLVAWRYTVSRITDFHLSPLDPDRLVRKSFERYLARLAILRESTARDWAQRSLG